MAKVTVLIAVYNAAPFLSECLDSLRGQSHADWQAICIDDCSTDSSWDVLRQYASADSRFSIIHLDSNHGQAYARNQGLAEAKGDFVCFLDADDWLSPNALAEALAVAEAHPLTDCVLFDVNYVYADHEELYTMPAFEQLTGSEAFRLSLDWQIHGVYMVRTAIHQRFPYDDTCKAYSDDNTTRLHYFASRQVRRCQGVYNYRQHAGSVTHAVSVRRFDFLKANESMKRQLIGMDADSDVMRLWETKRLLTLVDLYMFYHLNDHRLPPADAAYGLSEIRRVWHTLDRSLLDPAVASKFGYRPMPAWVLFRLQEWLYFTLRGWMGKNRRQ
ncbi:MAG: glycosyltransferase family 2 protein [Prevotella sp.]|nr:glycosyltransferase family 2 protein [Prevotella sp.]